MSKFWWWCLGCSFSLRIAEEHTRFNEPPSLRSVCFRTIFKHPSDWYHQVREWFFFVYAKLTFLDFLHDLLFVFRFFLAIETWPRHRKFTFWGVVDRNATRQQHNARGKNTHVNEITFLHSWCSSRGLFAMYIDDGVVLVVRYGRVLICWTLAIYLKSLSSGNMMMKIRMSFRVCRTGKTATEKQRFVSCRFGSVWIHEKGKSMWCDVMDDIVFGLCCLLLLLFSLWGAMVNVGRPLYRQDNYRYRLTSSGDCYFDSSSPDYLGGFFLGFPYLLPIYNGDCENAWKRLSLTNLVFDRHRMVHIGWRATLFCVLFIFFWSFVMRCIWRTFDGLCTKG